MITHDRARKWVFSGYRQNDDRNSGFPIAHKNHPDVF